MVNSPVGRTLAVIACTIVFSATCVLSAVAPAQAGTSVVAAAIHPGA